LSAPSAASASSSAHGRFGAAAALRSPNTEACGLGGSAAPAPRRATPLSPFTSYVLPPPSTPAPPLSTARDRCEPPAMAWSPDPDTACCESSARSLVSRLMPPGRALHDGASSHQCDKHKSATGTHAGCEHVSRLLHAQLSPKSGQTGGHSDLSAAGGGRCRLVLSHTRNEQKGQQRLVLMLSG
jgi:hypothetical protein